MDLMLGGEQSGHIVLSDYITTGDGLIAGLQVLVEVIRRGCKVSEACDQFKPVPQLLKNVAYKVEDPLNHAPVKDAIAIGEDRLNGSGRLVIRKSGTEDVMRVMAEGDDEAVVKEVVNDICKSIVEAA